MNGVGGFLEGLVVSLREGVEVALVIGILFAHLRRSGRAAYLRYVTLGLIGAILASLLGAVLVRRYGLNPENPTVEGSLMFVAAGLVVSLLVWMWRTGQTVRSRLERRLDILVPESETIAPGVRAALGVLAFTFFMVLREGVETVLFLTALSGAADSRPLSTALGAGFGLGLAILFGALLVRGSHRINLRRFFAVTGFVLLILVLKLIAGGTHEFFEAGLLPDSPFWEEAAELFASQAASIIVLALLVAAPLGCAAWDWWRAGGPHTPRQPNGVHP